MYKMISREDVIRIPPERLGDDVNAIVGPITKENFEGSVDANINLILVVRNAKPLGDGMIVHGDGGVYQRVRYDALIYRPELYELVEGVVVEVMKFGAFVRFGPLDGLIHISQIMDDHIDVDMKNEKLVGKESKRELKKDDRVRARIVTVSINERNPRESKIGLTMRQPGLGRLEWLEEERSAGSAAEESSEGKADKKKKKSKRK